VSGVDRARLAERQARLVASLVGDGSPPPGFDDGRLETLAAVLAAKRGRAIEHTWPRLARALGRGWPEVLAAHLLEVPGPPPSGALGDGRALARALAARSRLPWEGRLELLAAEVRWRWPADGRRLPRRAGAGLAAGRDPVRLSLALRAPWLGERWWHLPGSGAVSRP
jgi:hypothetical protein